MAETSIGIKIADGSFYPVLEEGIPGRKRVILTTVNDNQSGAQIDLYRGNGTGIAGATYIGTLVIDEIEPAPQGNPEIELIVKLDKEGRLDAQASDHATGEHQTLSVALDSIGRGAAEGLPELEIDERYQPELGVSPAEQNRLTSESMHSDFSAVEEDVRRVRRRRVLQWVSIGVLAAAIIVIVVLLVLWISRRPAASAPTTATPAASTPAASTPAKAAPAQPAPAQTTPTPPAQPTQSAPAKSSASSTQTPAPASGQTKYREGGVAYQIRWGDTLWDLSNSFYRTPWLYGKIAKANNIKNPNLIFAQTQIYIPER